MDTDVAIIMLYVCLCMLCVTEKLKNTVQVFRWKYMSGDSLQTDTDVAIIMLFVCLCMSFMTEKNRNTVQAFETKVHE